MDGVQRLGILSNAVNIVEATLGWYSRVGYVWFVVNTNCDVLQNHERLLGDMGLGRDEYDTNTLNGCTACTAHGPFRCVGAYCGLTLFRGVGET